MNGQILLPVVAVALAGLLALRIAISVPGWVRRARRPEMRSILVIGVGGGGSNAVERMIAARIPAVGFVACNTDAQALRRSTVPTRLRIGDAITHGLGCGGDPETGRKAAEQDRGRIGDAVAGSDLVFVTAGLGGGTGSGAAPIVAAAAKERAALTIAVVTKPFAFEGVERQRIADAAAVELAASADAMIVVGNDRVADVLPDDASVADAFRAVDDILLWAVRGIIDLTRTPGLINLDFADVRSILADAGPAMIGVGHGSGPDRAVDAARQAASSPLLETSIDGARSLLFNVSGAPDLRLGEVRLAADFIRSQADPAAKVIFGTTVDPAFGEDVVITLIAAGLAGVPEGTTVAASAEAAATPPGPMTALAPTIAPTPEPAPARTTTAATSSSPASDASTGVPLVARGSRRGRRDRSVVAPAVGVDPTASTSPPPTTAPLDEQDLEVPSFLRRRRSR